MTNTLVTVARRDFRCCSKVSSIFAISGRWASTTAAATFTTGSKDADRQRRRPRPLAAFIPALQSRFSELAQQNDGVFPLFPARVEAELRSRWNPDDSDKRAAVLISLYADNDGTPSLLFTRRSSAVPNNPSEISFPGGHQEPGETLLETALREAREELLGPHSHDWWQQDSGELVILGEATTIPSIVVTPVTPFVAVLLPAINDQDLERTFPGDHNEVESVLGLTLRQLYDTEETHNLPEHRLLGKKRTGPRYPTPQGDYVWGLTAFMLRPLLHRVFQPVFQWPTHNNPLPNSNTTTHDKQHFVDFSERPNPYS